MLRFQVPAEVEKYAYQPFLFQNAFLEKMQVIKYQLGKSMKLTL